MNFKTTITLLVLLVLLGLTTLVIWKVLPSREDRDQARRAQMDEGRLLLPDLKADDIAAVTVTLAGRTITLSRDGADWMQTQPVRYALNNWNPDQLAADLAGLKQVQRITPGQAGQPTLTQAQLEPPVAQITFITRSQQTHTLRLGRVLAVGGRGYAMLDSDPNLYIVSSDLHTMVRENPFTQWRKRSLPMPAEGTLTAIELTLPGRQLTLVQDQGQWRFRTEATSESGGKGGAAGRVSSEAVRAMTTAVAGVYIEKFVEDQPADLSAFGLDQPRLRLTLHHLATPIAPPAAEAAPKPATMPDAGAKPLSQTLLVGGPADFAGKSFYAAMLDEDAAPQVVFELDKIVVDKLQPEMDALRDPRVTLVRPDMVKQIVVMQPVAENPAMPAPGVARPWDYSLSKTPTRWQFDEPAPAFGPDAQAISTWLTGWSQLKAQRYVTPARPAGQPRLVIQLTEVGKTQPESLAIFEAERLGLLFAPATATSLPTPPAPTRGVTTGAASGVTPGATTQPGGWVVIRNDERTGRVISAEMMQDLLVPAGALRDRTVWDLHADTLTAIEVKRPGEPTVQLTKTPPAPAATQPVTPRTQTPVGAEWRLNVSAGDFAVEPGTVETLVQAVSPLRAERWLTRGLDSEAMEDASLTMPGPEALVMLTITTDSGATHRLALDPATRRGYEVPLSGERTLTGPPAMFDVSAALVDAVQAEFRRRQVFDLRGQPILGVGIYDEAGQPSTHPEHGFTASFIHIRRDSDNRFVPGTLEGTTQPTPLPGDGDTSPPINQAAAGGLFDTLAGLRAERFGAMEPEHNDVIRRFDLTLGDGRTLSLSLTRHPLSSPVVFLKGQPIGFTLSPDTLKKLMADVHAPLTPAPPPAPAPEGPAMMPSPGAADNAHLNTGP